MKNPLVRMRQAARNWVMKALSLSGVDSNRGWVRIFGSGLGFQTDKKYSRDDILQNPIVFACAAQPAKDVAKLCPQLKEWNEKDGMWLVVRSPAFTPVLRKPNSFQTRQQFLMCWILSKQLHGNAYILLVRDARQVVTGMFVLDPNRVTPLVATDGSVFYQLQRDDLSKLPFDYPAVPASEIIHDRSTPLFHPLVGIPPLWAAHWPASQGLRILQGSDSFFRNSARPSGILTSPHEIDDEDAKQLKSQWEREFTGANAGRLAVLGGDVRYVAMAATAEQSQLVEQSKLSAEQICSAFGVPAFKVGVGPTPSYDNVEALNRVYYSDVLHDLIEAVESLLDESLGLSALGYRIEFDLDDLFRLDMLKQAEVAEKYVGAGVMAPNEVRARLGYKPVKGGESPYLQQQNWQLGQLSERSAPTDGNQLPPADDAAANESKYLREVEESAMVAKASLPPLVRQTK